MKKLLFVVVLLSLVGAPLFAEWHSFDQNRGPQQTQFNLQKSSANETVFTVNIAGYFTQTINADGESCILLVVPGSIGKMVKGEPTLPRLAKLIRIPNNMKPVCEIIDKQEVEIDLAARILPSKGHLLRNIDPSTVPYEFGPQYNQDAWLPAQQVVVNKTFRTWDMTGVALHIYPVQYNPVAQKARIIKSITIKVSYQPALQTRHNLTLHRMPARYRRTYRRAFMNFKQMAAALHTRATGIENMRGNLVCAFQDASWKDGIGAAYTDWKNWKTQCGYNVVEVYGSNASSLKDAIWQHNPVAIVLFGDANANSQNATPMPTFQGGHEGAACDRTYACHSDPLMNDALFSRISGTQAECADQLTKIMNYEKAGSGSWTNIAIGISSTQGSPSDQERMGWLINGGGDYEQWIPSNQGLKNIFYSTFDTYFTNYSNSSYVNAIKNTINSSGCGSIWYIGHGSSTSWVSTGFNTSDAGSLTNGLKMPFIFSVACVNGNFARTGTCFTEAWLRNANGGAVAMEGSSTNEAWVPPCIKQAGSAKALLDGERCFGTLEKAGLLLAKSYYSDGSEYTQLAEQCNVFGDCTVIIKATATARISPVIERGLDNVTINVGVEGAVITVFNADYSFAFTQISDANGSVTIPLQGVANYETLYYTVVGADLTPIVKAELK